MKHLIKKYLQRILIFFIVVFYPFTKINGSKGDFTFKHLTMERGLSSKENIFTIEFATLEITSLIKNQFAYKFAGFNDGLINFGNKQQAPLDKSEYIFTAKTLNNDGIWNEEGTSLQIIVVPPFWKTIWFQIIVVFLIGFLFLLLHRIRTKNLLKHSADLEKEILERKQAEEALRESEAELRKLSKFVETTGESIVMTDIEGKVTYVNDSLIKTLNYNTSEEIIGKMIFEFSDKEGIKLLQEEILPTLLSKGRWKGSMNVKRKDGSFFHANQICSIIKDDDNNHEYMVALIEDITERKQAEERFSKLANFNENIVSSVPIGILTLNKEGEVTSTNEAFINMIGSPGLEETLKLNIYIPSLKKVGITDAIEKTLTTGESFEIKNQQYTSPWGKELILNLKGVPQKTIDGDITGIIIVVDDITKSRLAKEELIRHETALLKQLTFAKALNRISQEVILVEDRQQILDSTVRIAGEVLNLDRCSIYEVDLEKRESIALCEWLNPNREGVTSTKANYSLELFRESEKYISENRTHLESHFNDINPLFVSEGSDKILHEQMDIKSLLWHPFAFRSNSYYLLVFNQVKSLYKWEDTELAFTKSLAHQVEIAIMKVIFLNEQQRSAEALAESEEKYRQLVEQSNDAVYLLIDKRFEIINPRFTEMFGYTLGEVSKPEFDFIQLIAPQSLNFIQERIEKYKKGEELKPIYEFAAVTKEGKEIECEVSTSIIQYKDKKATQGIIRNITERKKAEKKILQLSRAVEQTPVSIVITDLDGNIEYVNPKFTEMTDISYEEALGQNPRVLKSGEQPREFYHELWETINSGSIWSGEFHNKKKNGDLFWESAIISPIKDKEGKVTHFVAIKEDITEKKEMISELIEAKERAEKADKLKSTFLAQMSHEIRTPINALVSMSSLLRYDFEENANEDQLMSFEVIERAGVRIIRTVDLLLNLSEIQAGTYEPHLTKFDVFTEVISQIVTENKILAKSKNIDLNLVCLVENSDLVADHYTVAQIFTQLIDNAIKYTNEGKISIRILRNKAEQLVVEIEDTGIGIEEEYKTKIFEAFTQVEMGYTRKYEGNGIGLTLVKTYCELNNAVVNVESEKGKGSTFSVVFK
ncbi:MAG: PAS domain S-box protein [Melioribacteraceae bacterium]|nr:PAS domain S-box protein [Melioribacteraceae bacterium]